MVSKQIPFSFEVCTDYGLDAYFVEDSIFPNPLKIMLNPALWCGDVLLVCGQPASGKTHLSHIYANHYKVPLITGADMGADIQDMVLNTGCVIDNIIHMDEMVLFHLLNGLKQKGKQCMLTSSLSIEYLPFATPDVQSRLQQAMLITLKDPSDSILQHILLKTLNDYNLFLPNEVVSYIIPRMERSYESVQTFVSVLNTKSLAEKSNVTIPFVKGILDDINGLG